MKVKIVYELQRARRRHMAIQPRTSARAQGPWMRERCKKNESRLENSLGSNGSIYIILPDKSTSARHGRIDTTAGLEPVS